MSFSVKLRTDEFKKGLPTVGPIWLEMDGYDFPTEGWIDFPVVILGWWLSNLKPMVTNQSASCECPFMDGPLRFDVTVRKREDWAINFIRDELDGEKRLLEGAVDPQTLISEVLSAANLAIEVCRQKEWMSDDLVTLEKEVREIEGLMRSFLRHG